MCLFYSAVDPYAETWNKHIKQYIGALKGPPNLKTPPEWHGADAYGLHVIIKGMHYKNKAVDECVKSKGFAEK